jgi:hypothetical protein
VDLLKEFEKSICQANVFFFCVLTFVTQVARECEKTKLLCYLKKMGTIGGYMVKVKHNNTFWVF